MPNNKNSIKKYKEYWERSGALRERRNLKMAGSAQAYMRGNTQNFYEWLSAASDGDIPDGPPVWICGDCHFGNLGPLADTDGRITIEIRDLDHTIIGNPAHDLVRLGLSLALAARGSDLPGVTTAKMHEQLTEGYQQALAEPSADFEEKPDCVRLVMRKSVKRTWRQLAKERLENTRPTIPLGRSFWPLSPDERQEIEQLFSTEPVRRLATSLRHRNDHAPTELLDAAYWGKGCSSLGRLRFAVLLGVDDDFDEEGALCLMDIKEAVPAAGSHGSNGDMAAEDAVRVVSGARHLSPALGERMLAARLLDRPVFIRELLPQDLKVEINRLSREEALKTSLYLAMIVGRAHAKQMDASTREKWRAELMGYRSSRFDAPSWLWSSVVALVAKHEAAYLEHCRIYALETALQT